MDAVTFHGREYIKATSLALKYRYTPDYLGQLARAKKVDARLVGRAWYIHEDSLIEHRDGKYKTTNESEITEKVVSKNYVSRVAVEPYLKNKTARIVLGQNGLDSRTEVSYEEDDQSLMPSVKKHSKPTRLNVNIADSEKVKISTENKKPTNFKPEPLPEVALSGTLVIADISDEEETPVIPEEIPVIAPAVAKKAVMIRPRRPGVAVKRPIQPQVQRHSVTPSVQSLSTHAQSTVPTSFTPGNIPKATVSKTRTQQPATKTSLLVPALAVVGAFLVSFGLLATNLEISASGSEYDSSLNVALANILLLLP